MNRYLLFVLLSLSTPSTFASLATLTGGSLTAYATAGGDGGTVGTDNPAPVIPGMGLTRLSASASGISLAVCDVCPAPVSSSALANANIVELPNGDMTFQLDSASSAQLVWIGMGIWTGASSTSSVEVKFTVFHDAIANLHWTWDTFFGQVSATVTKDGEPFDISSANGNTATYLFKPGEYEIALFSSQGSSYDNAPAIASTSMTLTLATPLAGSIWLFGPALAGLVAVGRRKNARAV
ncbi:MAG: hypothetical protein FIA97_09780 [Methylococcaceae bacterium]|nr:hypothetical protein [Methylococcaceae bacterium]